MLRPVRSVSSPIASLRLITAHSFPSHTNTLPVRRNNMSSSTVTPSPQPIDVSEALQFCIDLAYEAGAKALTFCHNRPRPTSSETIGSITGSIASKELQVQHKEDESPVTIADKLVNELIVSKLRLRYPSSRVIGEESVGAITDDLAIGDVFYVDPIDGTKEFIRNNGEWAVMIGMVRNGTAVMGVVYHADADHMFYATHGGGCFVIRGGGSGGGGSREQVRLQRCKQGRTTTAAEEMVVAKSRSHPDERIDAVAQNLGITRSSVTGSFGLKCARFAEGEVDLYINTRSCYWDSAPSELLVRESGGVLVDATSSSSATTGEQIVYNGLSTDNRGVLVTCPRELQERVVAEIRSVFLKE